MASIGRTNEGNIVDSGIVDLYSELLFDLNVCINSFEDLEEGRTWTEAITDWAAGDRAEINGKRMILNLTKLRKEVKCGFDIFSRLFAQMDIVRRMRISIASSGSRILAVKLEQHFEEIWGIIIKFKITGLFSKKDYKPSKAGLLLAGIDLLFGYGVFAIGFEIYSIARMIGSIRGLKYQQVKQLSDSLVDIQFISYINTFHTTLDAAVKSVEILLAQYREYPPKSIELITSRIQPAITVSVPQTPHRTSAPEPQAQAECSTDKIGNGIKATNLYNKQMTKSLQNSLAEHPDWSEEVRKAMATYAAVAACTTYLKEVCRVSDAEVNQLLKTIQDDN